MITADELTKWQALCDAATEGPWDVDLGETYRIKHQKNTISTMCLIKNWRRKPLQQVAEDASFIAESRTAMPRLIEEVETQRRSIEHLRQVKGVAETEAEHARLEVRRLRGMVSNADLLLMEKEES